MSGKSKAGDESPEENSMIDPNESIPEFIESSKVRQKLSRGERPSDELDTLDQESYYYGQFKYCTDEQQRISEIIEERQKTIGAIRAVDDGFYEFAADPLEEECKDLRKRMREVLREAMLWLELLQNDKEQVLRAYLSYNTLLEVAEKANIPQLVDNIKHLDDFGDLKDQPKARKAIINSLVQSECQNARFFAFINPASVRLTKIAAERLQESSTLTSTD